MTAEELEHLRATAKLPLTTQLLEHIDTLRAENARLREALTPSAETKAAYIGEFDFLQEAYSEEHGEEVTCRVTVPWPIIKEIMAAIRARAALEGK